MVLSASDPISHASARHRGWLSLLFRQCWAFCLVYLLLGLGLEVARRLGAPWANKAISLLDGIPILALRVTGLLDRYLELSLERIPPWADRLVLSGMGLIAVGLQIFVVGLVVFAIARACRRPV